MLTEDEIKKYLKAGEIVHHALNMALDIVEEGKSLLDIAEKLENDIINRGGKLAFPANISINHIAAHYSPSVNDDKVIPRESIVKVDLGAHVDGYIADAAITISFNPEYEKLLTASRYALRNAERVIRPGKNLGVIGEVIEKTILKFGFKPIANLNGHKIERFSLHAGKSVPNTSVFTFKKIGSHEVYAIEPFATDGEGYVIEGESGHIYQIITMRRIKGYKDLDRFLKDIWREYRSLPFSERWIYKKYGEEGLNKLNDLREYKRTYLYHLLMDEAGGMVSQFEDTVIVTEKEVLITTNVLELYR
ncbi:MAG: type II methionyl aminopeptidase [Thermofilum sp. ex4484_79]|nr:MAG: type II methionyl aminopeptidase [Thermofilum sp. ex4484_79]